MKKWLTIFSINIVVLSELLLLISIPAYFYGVYKLDSFLAFEGEQSEYYRVDSLAMFIHKPNVEIKFDWKEHPNQEITFITNNLGFREDNETNPNKVEGSTRILVTGDSHTDGVIFNSESFPNIAEQVFNERDSAKVYEIINGGTGFYSFKNYYGFIEKYKNLNPDYFLINVFTGNDFRETLLYEEESRSYINIIKNGYLRAKRKLLLETRLKVPLNQGLDQQYYFKTFPADFDSALNYAKFYTSKIDSLCKAEDIELVITLLPTKTETDKDFKERIMSEYSWSEDILNINSNFKESYQSWLASNGVRTIDLLDTLSNPQEKVFWDKDLHINLEAHKRIGLFLADNLFEE